MANVRNLRDIIERLKTNWRGYIRQYHLLLILTALAATADMVSTIYIMLVYGPEAEWHPTIRLLSTVFGPVLGPMAGKLWQLAVVVALTVYLRFWARYIFVTVIFVYTWAAWYNIWGRFIYYPVILELLDSLHF
jgi:hypothetical protein